MPLTDLAGEAATALVARGSAATLALLFFALSLSITATRMRTDRLFGIPADPADLLAKKVRAHGNTAEYCAVLMPLIFYLGTADRPVWVIGLMVVATASRLVYAYAMLTCRSLDRFDPRRAAAVTGTYLAGAGLALALVVT